MTPNIWASTEKVPYQGMTLQDTFIFFQSRQPSYRTAKGMSGPMTCFQCVAAQTLQWYKPYCISTTGWLSIKYSWFWEENDFVDSMTLKILLNQHDKIYNKFFQIKVRVPIQYNIHLGFKIKSCHYLQSFIFKYLF